MENSDLKILAVDDNYDNLITLKALILETYPNAQVMFALSGHEALSITERIIPDIILLDVVMPDMDGFEVCKRMKVDVNLLDIPIVFITALRGDKESRIRGLEVGAEAFLAKPIDETELVAQIRAMSKIRHANLMRREEQEQLSALVSEKTMQLELNNIATLNLLEDLQKEVDARRKTEMELLKSEARLRRAELASKSGNWEFNAETNSFYLSEGAVFLLGFERSEIDYHLFVDLIVPEDRTVFEYSLQQLLTKNLPFNVEFRIKPKGSSEIIDIRTFAVRDKDEQVIFGVLRNITEQKSVRKKLIESEAKFRELMDNSPEGIIISVDGIITYVNREAMNIMRAKNKTELIGRTVYDFIHPDSLQLIMERMQFVANTALNVALPSVEEKIIQLDGWEIDVEMKVMPIIFEGKPAIQISGHDITEKKLASQEIEQSRKELKTIYDNAPVMMCVVNENAEILFSNAALNTFIDEPNLLLEEKTACGDVFGCISSFNTPNGCGFGENCKSCILRNTISDTFKTGLEHNNIDYQTTVIRGKEQKRVALLASTSLIQSVGQKRLLLCMHDITARKDAEDALYRSEMLLRTFIDNVPFGIFARDVNNVGIIENIKHVEEFGTILGKTPEDYSVSDPEVAKVWKQNNSRAFKGEVINSEVEYTTLSGKLIPFQQIVFPIRSDNQIFGVAGINIDISDRIKAQKELLDYQKQLKNFAAHLQTVREEERVNLAREIHDDLGQILVAIKFDLGMLGIKSKKFVRDEAVEEFSKQFKRLEGFVNNTIKSTRRIMSDLRPELLDMVGLVEAFKEYIIAFNERQPIKCEFVNSTKVVVLSPEKAVALFRILQESLNNAAKYSEATQIKVELAYENKNIYLTITDNGVGFDMSIKKRSDSYGLTGMKERAYLLDGKVDIWSEPGKGVKIKVEVPEMKH